MRIAIVVLCLLLVAPSVSPAQLVVWDRSHDPLPWDIYSNFRAQLEAWGYTVEVRTTPLMDNGDADVIVILPEDAYTGESTDYTAQEATWLKDFVDGGKGVMAAICLNYTYWQHIEELMATFGISNGSSSFDIVHYDTFEIHPIFDGVTELGDDFGRNGALSAAPPSTAVAWNEGHEMMALYESGTGTALWSSHYYLMSDEGLADYDNLVFLENAFAWLTRGYVSEEESTWSDVKRMFE